MSQSYSCGEKDALQTLNVDGIKQKRQSDIARKGSGGAVRWSKLVPKRKWLKSWFLYGLTSSFIVCTLLSKLSKLHWLGFGKDERRQLITTFHFTPSKPQGTNPQGIQAMSTTGSWTPIGKFYHKVTVYRCSQSWELKLWIATAKCLHKSSSYGLRCLKKVEHFSISLPGPALAYILLYWHTW